jgi:hypothetical protein
MKVKDVPLLTVVFFTSMLLTGFIFNFSYFSKVEIQLHDAYVSSHPLAFLLVFWIVFTFIIYLCRGIITNFSNRINLWILLISNSFLILLLSYVGYVAMAFFSISAVISIVSKSDQHALRIQESEKIMFITAVFTIALCFVEYFLIGRLRKLKT